VTPGGPAAAGHWPVAGAGPAACPSPASEGRAISDDLMRDQRWLDLSQTGRRTRWPAACHRLAGRPKAADFAHHFASQELNRNSPSVFSTRGVPDDHDVIIHTEDVIIHTEDVIIHTEDVIIHTEDVIIHTEDVIITGHP
jgi:hypothetical protein